MGNLLKSWIFFTALMVFLIVAAAALPDLADRFFGGTEAQVEAVIADMEQKAQAVWAEWKP